MLVRPLVRSVVSPLVRGVTQRTRGKMPLVLGPELLVNGDFSNGATGWSVNNADATHIVTFAGGTMRFQSGTTSPQLNVQQANILTVTKTYQVVVEIAAYTSGALKMDMAAATVVVGTAPGTYTYRLTAANTNFNLTRSTANVDITVDRVSVREIISG